MQALDFFTRLIFIPGIFLFIISFIPEAANDIKEWKKLFIQESSKTKRKNKKAVQIKTVAPVYSNSFS